MSLTDIIASIDQEIARLNQVDAILSDRAAPTAGSRTSSKKGPRKKRTLSPEARLRIADAQKKRWATQKSTKKKWHDPNKGRKSLAPHSQRSSSEGEDATSAEVANLKPRPSIGSYPWFEKGMLAE